MKFSPEVHALQCPKCEHGMEEVIYENIAIDRCTHCQGLLLET